MWHNININSNLIVKSCEKSCLIKMPNNSEYSGFCFWHPSKLVRDGLNASSVEIGYSDDFVFHLKKYGKGKWNSFDVIAEKDITAGDFEDAFSVINDNISAKTKKDQYETHKPDDMKEVTAVVPDELIDK